MEGNDYIKIADQLGKTPKSIDNAIQRSRNKIKIIVFIIVTPKAISDSDAPIEEHFLLCCYESTYNPDIVAQYYV